MFSEAEPFPQINQCNVAYGPRVNGIREKNVLDEIVETAARAALWNEVKDNLGNPSCAFGRSAAAPVQRAGSGGETERDFDGRACASLDPIATQRIEELIRQLVEHYTIVIVTHNMQQAGRVSDYTAFFFTDESRTGRLVEFNLTRKIFTNPQDKRTEDYITGRFG